MASIKTAIQLYDGVSPVLRSMTKAMNIVLNSFESMHTASSTAIDTSSIQEAREELAGVSVELDRIEANLNSATSSQNKYTNSVNASNRSAGNLMRTLQTVAATVGGIQAVKLVFDTSDLMSQTTARMGLIAREGESAETIQNSVFAAANRSRALYEDTATTVAKIGINAGDTFDSTAEIVAFVEQLNKQYAIAGTSGAEMSASMLQLTQALGSGVLRGEELNSIFESAPTIIQAIADYVGQPIGKIREMASEGQITAEVIKNAIFAAAQETEARFNQMPVTFAQAWTGVKNTILEAIAPALQQLSGLVTSEGFAALTSAIITTMTSVISIVTIAFETIANIAAVIAENWSWIEPIVYGVVAAVVAYNAVMMIANTLNTLHALGEAKKAAAQAMATGATFAATAAQHGLNAALLASPLTWIVLGIGAVIVAITAWAKSIGGFEILWLKVVNGILTAWDWVKIGFHTGVNFVAKLFNNLAVAFYSVYIAIVNFMGDLKADVLSLLQGLVNGAIDIINAFISALNLIPFVSIDLIDQVTFGVTAQIENDAQKQARNSSLAKFTEERAAANAALDRGIETMKADARNSETARLAEIAAKQADLAAKDAAAVVVDENRGNVEQTALENINVTPYEEIATNTGSTAGSASKIADSMEISEEDLKYLRDIAEREVVNRFTTAEIVIEQTNNNTINSELDIDGVMERWNDDFLTILDTAAEGVY